MTAVEAVTAKTAAARRILIVDDDRDFADSLRNFLMLEGYDVECAYAADQVDFSQDSFATAPSWWAHQWRSRPPPWRGGKPAWRLNADVLKPATATAPHRGLISGAAARRPGAAVSPRGA